MMRQHQYAKHIQRTQIPLRLSFAMTGHKVQGLSLCKGVVVHYPTKVESKRDPMDIWGLNYCILTRVPDISKVAFINLPDYSRHVKLFNHKSKGKDHFRLFQGLDKKAYSEFERYVKICGRQTLDYLKNTNTKLSLDLPIDFHYVLQEERQGFQVPHHFSALHQVPLNVVDVRQTSKSHEFKKRKIIHTKKKK